MTTNQTRLELISEGAYIRTITKYQCKICEKIFTDYKYTKAHQLEHTEQEFIEAL